MANQSTVARRPVAPINKKRKSTKTSGVVKAFRTVAYVLLFVSAAFIALYYLFLVVNVKPNPKLFAAYTKLKPIINGKATGGFSLVYLDFVLLYVALIFLGIFGRKGAFWQILLPILAVGTIFLIMIYHVTHHGSNTTFNHPDHNIFDIPAVSKGTPFDNQQDVSIEPAFILKPFKTTKFTEKLFGGQDSSIKALLPQYNRSLAYMPISFVLLGAQFITYLMFAIVFGTRKRGMVASGLVMIGFTFMLLAVAIDLVLGGMLSAGLNLSQASINKFNTYIPVIRYSVYGLGHLVLACAGLIGVLSFKKN